MAGCSVSFHLNDTSDFHIALGASSVVPARRTWDPRVLDLKSQCLVRMNGGKREEGFEP